MRVIDKSIKSYNSLVVRFFESGGDRPRLIGYRKSGGLNALTFEPANLRFKDRQVALPVPRELKNDIICNTWIDIPDEIFVEQIKLIRIRPVAGKFWCDFIVDDGKQLYCNDDGELVRENPQLCYHQAISIDHGVKFWVSAVTTLGKSFIVNAPALKTAIWKYQQKVKQYKQGKSDFYWDDYLDKITLKYNNQVRDAVNKTARFIVNRCLKDKVGNLVFGWNKKNKQNINLGRKNNYEVVSMPTARLISRLRELCAEYGIKFIVTSEEYTSKASFVDQDELYQYGEKPTEWKPSGKRISRDVYCTKDGTRIHADINAAANIMRKVESKLFSKFQAKVKYQLIKNRTLTDPKQYDVFMNLKKKYCKQTSRSGFLTHVATSA
ncbi:MAG: transposase [Cyanobacteria bacterium P01_D01_bin.50]